MADETRPEFHDDRFAIYDYLNETTKVDTDVKTKYRKKKKASTTNHLVPNFKSKSESNYLDNQVSTNHLVSNFKSKSESNYLDNQHDLEIPKKESPLLITLDDENSNIESETFDDTKTAAGGQNMSGDFESRFSDRIMELERRLLECEIKLMTEHDNQQVHVNKKRRFDLENIEERDEEKCINISCLLEKVEQRDDTISRLREDIDRKNLEITNLKQELEKQMKFNCGKVFHSYVVYKGTDITVPCACRKDYTRLLPDELMLKIFESVPQCDLNELSRVCTRWNKLCYDSSLWKKIVLNDNTISLIDIEGYLSIGVESLTLSHAQISKLRYPKKVQFVVSPSERRKICNLKYLNLFGAQADASVIEKLIGRCRSLEFLDISFCTVNMKVFEHIKRNINLKTLRLRSLKDTCNNGWYKMDIVGAINHCKKIEDLDVSDSLFGYTVSRINFPATITNLGLEYILTCDSDIATLKKIIKLCPRMKVLNLSHCTGLDMDILDTIVSGLPELTVLEIKGLEDRFLPKLELLRNLKDFVELRGNFSDDSVAFLQSILEDVNICDPTF